MADPTLTLTRQYSPTYSARIGYTLPVLSDTDTPFPVISSTDCVYPGSGTPAWPASCTIIDGTSSPSGGTLVYSCTVDGKRVYYFHDGTEALAELMIYEGMALVYSSSAISSYADWDAYNAAVGTELFIDLPTSVLESEKEYTFSLRVTITSNHRWEYWQQQTGRWDHYQCPQYVANSSSSGWATLDGVVNEIPVVSDVSTNGEASPKLVHEGTALFMFRVDDDDGPALNYWIESGIMTPSGFMLEKEFSAELGRIVGGRDFSITYDGSKTSNVQYAWRVRADDEYPYGDGVTSWSPLNYFRFNALAHVNSLEMGGEELLTGIEQTIGSQDVLVEWNYVDPEGAAQTAYRLVLTPSSGSPITYENSTAASSFTIPLIPPGSYTVTFSVKDDIEYGIVSTGRIISNARPRATSLKVEDEVNPSDVTTATPTIKWTFRDDDADDTQQKYRIQVATDSSFQNLVWDTGQVTGATDNVVYGTAVPSPIVAPVALTHQKYYFRVQVYDGVSWSSFDVDGYGSFYVNNPPGDPTLSSPSSGTYAGTLTVTWTEAVPPDDDSDEVSYVIEMTDNFSEDKGWTQVAGPIPEGTTSWEISLAQRPSGDDYAIRIIATDGIATSDPSNGGTSPRFGVEDHAPTTPTFVAPASGSTSAHRIVAEWQEADPVDVDGDAVLYRIWITLDGGSSWTIVDTVPAGNTRAVIEAGDYDNGTVQLRMQAIDQNGSTGSYKYSDEFQLDNSAAATDFETLNGIRYVSTIDGRLRKIVGRNWTLEQPWTYGPPTEFEAFSEGNPSVTVKDGKMYIAPKTGSTFILRQTKD